MSTTELVTSSAVSVKKPSSKKKPSTLSGNKFWKKKGRLIEVPIGHAVVATEAHLRALSIINDDEEVSIEFTPTMVQIILTKTK